MARRSEHSQEEIKAMVLSAAESIIVEQGHAALTVRKIAFQIGYTVGSIYMVFDNMADLVLHINANTLDLIADELEQARLQCEQNGQPTNCIEAFAITYLNFARQNLHRWRLIFDFNPPNDSPNPDWYQAKIDKVFALVEAQIKLLDYHCPEAEAKQIAHTLWAGVHGVCELSLNGTLGKVGVNDVAGSVASLTRHFINGWINSGRKP